MEIQLSTGEVKFDLVLNGKFSVIIGNSGTGKSRLASIVAKIEEDEDMSRRQPIMPVHIEWEEWVHTPSQRLIVVDEGLAASQAKIRRNLQAMKESVHYYIFCMRDDNDYIPHGLGTTFVLTGGPSHYKMVPAYDGRLLTRRIQNLSHIICEDSGLGYSLLRAILAKSGIDVSSSCGRSKLLTALERTGRDGNACIVFDSCGAGRQLKAILHAVKNGDCTAFDTPSLEHEIGAGLFGEEAMRYNSSRHSLYPSEEAFYKATLTELLVDYSIPYSKSSEALAALLANGKGMLHDGFHDLRAEGLDVTKIYPEFRELAEGD